MKFFSFAFFLFLAIISYANPALASEDTDSMNAPIQKHGILELYRCARGKDAALLAGKARLEGKHAEKTIARSYLLPRLDMSGSTSKVDHSLVNYYGGDKKGKYNSYNYGVVLRQPLFDGVNWFGLKSADIRIRSTLADVLEAEQNLILFLTDLYCKVLKAINEEKITQKERDRLNELLKEAEAKFRERTGDVVAVYEAKAALDAQEARLVKARGGRELLENELSRVAGIRVSSSSLKESVLFEPKGPEPSELKSWLDATLKNHPILIKSREELTLAENELKRTYASYLPTVQIVGSYSMSKGEAFLPELETERWLYGVEMRLPLFEGGKTAGTVDVSVARVKEVTETLKGYEEDLSKKTEIAFLDLDLNLKLYSALEQQFYSASVQLKGVKKGREIGTRTQTDLINAEQVFFKAETELRNALYENIILGIKLKKASGILNETDILELEQIFM